MIRVGFIIKDINSWTGGFNYYKSLLSALNNPGFRRRIEAVVLTPPSQMREIESRLDIGCECAGLSCLETSSLSSYTGRILKKIIGRNVPLEKGLAANKIDVLSHVSNADAGPGVISIGWIPDFQHIHLPYMFTGRLLEYRNRTYAEVAENSAAVILSSNDALDDYRKFAPRFADKGRVLNFAQAVAVDNFDSNRYEAIKVEYGLPDRYFYVPNQFWKHKNHMVVLGALKILKNSGLSAPKVVFSGLNKDYRNAGYLKEIENYIVENGLSDNAIMLGLIDYQKVYYLMRYSAAVINPSLFEGWSSTVEECKAIDKYIILSDIKVHIEQAPAKAEYFSAHDPAALADILRRVWSEPPFYDDIALKAKLEAHELKRLAFAEKYQDIVLSVYNRRESKG